MDISNTIKQTIAISFITSLVVALLAFSGGYFIGQTKVVNNQNINKVSDKPQEKQDAPLEENREIYILSGTVKEINDDNILINISKSDERIVEIDGNTKIYVLEEKSHDQYQKEMDEYLKKLKDRESSQLKLPDITAMPSASSLAPGLFAEKIGTKSDIKSGITLTVFANQNIKDIKQFKAAEIFIPPPRANEQKK